MKADSFCKVDLPVKPYIKAHLENRFGNPVVFPDESDEKKRLNDLLARPTHRRDKQYTGYAAEVSVMIEEDVFYRYGYELTGTNITEFNTYLQYYFKVEMRLYILMGIRHKNNIVVVINDFLKEYNLNEDLLSVEAIQKDFYRYRQRRNINIEGQRWGKNYGLNVRSQKDKKKQSLVGSDYGIIHKINQSVDGNYQAIHG